MTQFSVTGRITDFTCVVLTLVIFNKLSVFITQGTVNLLTNPVDRNLSSLHDFSFYPR